MKYLKLFESYTKLPKIVYHATPIINLESIKENGLTPEMDEHFAGQGEIHKDRVFVSIFNHPLEMNLPMEKLDGKLAMLTIDTTGLDPNNFYPDDSLYWAFYNDELSDEQLAVLFPKLYKKFLKEDEDDFGDWIIDNDYDITNEEFDKLMKGKFHLTLPGSKIEFPSIAGEIAYKGIIPIKNIKDIQII